MPTYDYICETCGHKFEKFQSMSEKPLKKCPECGKGVRKLIGSGIGVLFKSSGFYETDYKKKSPSSGGTCCGRTVRCDRPPCLDRTCE